MNTVLVSSKCTSLTLIHPGVYWSPQVMFCRAAFQLSVLMSRCPGMLLSKWKSLHFSLLNFMRLLSVHHALFYCIYVFANATFFSEKGGFKSQKDHGHEIMLLIAVGKKWMEDPFFDKTSKQGCIHCCHPSISFPLYQSSPLLAGCSRSSQMAQDLSVYLTKSVEISRCTGS